MLQPAAIGRYCNRYHSSEIIIGGEEKAPVKRLRPGSCMEFEKFGPSHVRVRIRQNCAKPRSFNRITSRGATPRSVDGNRYRAARVTTGVPRVEMPTKNKASDGR